MSNPSRYYSFNLPDVNLNKQIVNWATGTPVYDASLNSGAYISRTNYKTGNGSLEMAKNTIASQDTTRTSFSQPQNGSYFSITDDQLTVLCCVTNGFTYYQTRNNITTSFTNTWSRTNNSDTLRNYYYIPVTADGNRFVTCVKYGLVYYATRVISGTGGYSTLTQTADNTTRNYQAIAMTKDGNKIVACSGIDAIYFANWNGNNYDPFIQTLERNATINYVHIGITSNGDRIVYSDYTNKTRYLSFWNGTNYNSGSQLPVGNGKEQGACCFNSDASILFLSYVNQLNTIEFGKYNINTNLYDTFTNINTGLIVGTSNPYSIWCVDSSSNTKIYVNNFINGSAGPIYYGNLLYNTTTANNYCNVSPNITTNGVTIACWFRSNYNLNNARIFDFATANTGTSDNIRLLINNNALRFDICVGTTLDSSSYITSGNINDNSWNHIAITMNYTTNNTSTITTYINGLTSTPNTFINKKYPNTTTRSYSYLGKSNTTGDPQFFGNIDDFRIYNDVLNDTQISSLYTDTNVKNNYRRSTISLLYTTPVENASTPITPNTTLINVGSSKTYYYWNDPYATTNTIINKSNPYNFYYTYNNTTQIQSTKVSIIINDFVTLVVNGVIQTNLLNSGSTYSSPVIVKLADGNNLFEFLTYNNGGPAYFAAYVTDSNNNYLFSTNSEKTGWNIEITGLFSNGYPVSSLIVGNSLSTEYTTATAITTPTNYKTFNLDLSNNKSCKQIKLLDMNLKSNNNDLANIFLSYP